MKLDLREVLDETMKSLLLRAVRQVALHNLPAVTAPNAIGAGIEGTQG